MLPRRSVTLTGADDRTNIDDLIALSREYPFVEWGILRSEKRMGTPRYPSQDWYDRMVDGALSCNIAIHLCGVAKQPSNTWAVSMGIRARNGAQRIQLNGIGRDEIPRMPMRHHEGHRWILQAPDARLFERFVGGPGRCPMSFDTPGDTPWPDKIDVLYDPSGGRGTNGIDGARALLFRIWSCSSNINVPSDIGIGFSGGLGPHNVKSMVDLVQGGSTAGHRHIWLDMESGVRTDEVFDLDKCRAVLEACKGWAS